MCSNKSIDDFRRDSFSHRVCDDLCQFILQYLSLEDRLRLECVSKQLQRNIFMTKKSLDINLKDMAKSGWIKHMENVLKKCPNINKIVSKKESFTYSGFKVEKYNEFIELIVKYCDNLTHFHFFYNSMSEDNRQKFGRKFRSKLKSVDFEFCHRKEVPNFLSLIDVTKVEDLSISGMSIKLSQIRFNSLKSFVTKDINNSDVMPLKNFLELNGDGLRYLFINGIEVHYDIPYDILMNSISKLKNLIHLSLCEDYTETDHSFDKRWTQIAQNCKQIKSLEIYCDFQLMNDTSIEHHLQPLRQFQELKRLKIKYNAYNRRTGFKFKGHLYSFQLFRGFERLTSVELIFTQRVILPMLYSESILTGIDINLPNLRSLTIRAHVDYTEWSAFILSRLSKLESIHLMISDETIGPMIEEELIANCKLISRIDLEFKEIEYSVFDHNFIYNSDESN